MIRLTERIEARVTREDLQAFEDARAMLDVSKSELVQMYTHLLKGAGRFSFLRLQHTDGEEYYTLIIDGTVLLFHATTYLLTGNLSIEDLRHRYVIVDGVLVPVNGNKLHNAVFVP